MILVGFPSSQIPEIERLVAVKKKPKKNHPEQKLLFPWLPTLASSDRPYSVVLLLLQLLRRRIDLALVWPAWLG